MKIAGNLTVNDWNELEKKIKDSENELWGLAAHFFEERIKTRYLAPIHAIQNLNLKEGEGFAMVNLQCSLIETFECFINGWLFYLDDNCSGCKKNKIYWKNANKEEISKSNKDIFISFFDKFKDKFDGIDGESFYSNVRCGLLHETQTKNNWVINVADEKNKKCYEEKGEKYIIYRNNFQNRLEKLLEEYQQTLINGKNFRGKEEFRGISTEDLRLNFIAKMTHICKQS
ncbi:hypothetical protein [Tenacibaculum finnmarkense]|uniref:Uncharacterized protein n=1 Tax=Tenacibaculum finnmarkense genomovar finnmarkense TaxID=1458503 RepID=A0AAP1RI58_9FLAO|nr:hypothetical protein [Tenacibaculum finnmarkense]MBE7653926.1 hypothetical protein [Tenacibaculum finnmarkense genomovar finnmarkense]MBE7696228.1 hypothetical protein [Tenacibaculum finnmarkense genomovar finnmarkense]MCD8428471.1 hypothetical protein [Tenacibaculum finnmarkense genomovar finnmarkense]MCG8732245.1 hypothetical protein [Tenacibaculum finnmarkense]MCG8752924.1 hypothetical protein [Tenacibaculum finnmarkense]